jgi:hypothetical protein
MVLNFGDCSRTILAFFAPGNDAHEVLYYGKWMLRFETKRKGLFCDFWHIHDDFAIKNATNIIFKPGKAQSYSSLHDLSNDAKCCACLHGNRKENATARALSIVHRHWSLEIHCPSSEIILAFKF